MHTNLLVCGVNILHTRYQKSRISEVDICTQWSNETHISYRMLWLISILKIPFSRIAFLLPIKMNIRLVTISPKATDVMLWVIRPLLCYIKGGNNMPMVFF